MNTFWLVYIIVGGVWLMIHVIVAIGALTDTENVYTDMDRYRVLSTLWMPFLWPLGLVYGVFWLARDAKRKAGLADTPDKS